MNRPLHRMRLPIDWTRCHGTENGVVCERRELCTRYTDVRAEGHTFVDWACDTDFEHFIDNAPEELQ